MFLCVSFLKMLHKFEKNVPQRGLKHWPIPRFHSPGIFCAFLQKNLLLGVLLEAGGCSTWPDGTPGPDPFYVDQVKATIQQLESLDVINQCEIR